MEKEKLESLLIDYIDGKLPEADRLIAEHELARSNEAKELYAQLKEVTEVMDHTAQLEPSVRIANKFEEVLRQEIAQANKGKQVFMIPMIARVAAGLIILMMGIGIGYWINKDRQREQELATLKQEVENNKNMMLQMLDNQQSASQRMMGTTVAFKMEKADDEIVAVLVKMMNEDPNSNVRLAALEALSKFQTEPAVRKALIASVSKQKDPVVQIALIQLMVKMKEKSVVKDLERITGEVQTMKAVKDEAYKGILKLS